MFLPRDYCYLEPTSTLSPADLVTIASDLARFMDWERDDLAGWYRPLALALFEQLELLHLPQLKAVASAKSGSELRKALGVVEEPDWNDGLGRAWVLRERLLALPGFGAGTIEGHPFLLAHGRDSLPVPVRPLARGVSDALLEHAKQALDLARELDRVIVALWGCPVERLEQKVRVSQLEKAGLELQQFED